MVNNNKQHSFNIVKVMIMNDKELRKISRKELLELLLAQAKRIEELETELNKTKEELNSKKIIISESGNLAEASLKLSGIFEVAQQAADEYLYNIQETCKKIENDTKKECKKTLKETKIKCQEIKQEADEYYNNAKEKVKELTQKVKVKNNKKNKSDSSKKKTKEKTQKANTKETNTLTDVNCTEAKKEVTENKVVVVRSKKAIKGRPVKTIKKRKVS